MPNSSSDHDLLIRIDERVKNIQDGFEDLQKEVKVTRHGLAVMRKKVYTVFGGLTTIQVLLSAALNVSKLAAFIGHVSH